MTASAELRYGRELDQRFTDQDAIDRHLRACTREQKAQMVLEAIQSDLDSAMNSIKRAVNPPPCHPGHLPGFHAIAHERASGALVSMQAMILMLYQLQSVGIDLERSEQFRARLERATEEELGL